MNWWRLQMKARDFPHSFLSKQTTGGNSQRSQLWGFLKVAFNTDASNSLEVLEEGGGEKQQQWLLKIVWKSMWKQLHDFLFCLGVSSSISSQGNDLSSEICACGTDGQMSSRWTWWWIWKVVTCSRRRPTVGSLWACWRRCCWLMRRRGSPPRKLSATPLWRCNTCLTFLTATSESRLEEKNKRLFHSLTFDVSSFAAEWSLVSTSWTFAGAAQTHTRQPTGIKVLSLDPWPPTRLPPSATHLARWTASMHRWVTQIVFHFLKRQIVLLVP